MLSSYYFKNLALFSALLPFAVTARMERRQSEPIGTTVGLDYGTYNGERDASSGITAFRGVRYANSPTGDLRWMPPVTPPTVRFGEVDATKFRKRCIPTKQSGEDPNTSEDCLFGNIFVPPNTTTESGLPVLVWFHGGGFQGGDSHNSLPVNLFASSPSPFLFVSFEYRLGQFGFLGGQAIKANGTINAGFLDQRAALKWVQIYIDKFGGDKSKVTIWGQSAGAGSTMFHLIANDGDQEGLFRSAIGNSPSLTFMPTFDSDLVETTFSQFVELAGCKDATPSPLACLRSKDTATLATAGSRLLPKYPSTLFVFAPLLDSSPTPAAGGSSGLLTTRPVPAFRSGKFARVPVLFGANTNEGNGWSGGLADPLANVNSPDANRETVVHFMRGQYRALAPERVRDAVGSGLGLYPLESYGGDLKKQLSHLYGETRYMCTAGLITGGVGESGLSAFQYHYDNPRLGSGHSAEMRAFFGNEDPPDSDAQDGELFRAMREYWTSFVVNGVPSAKTSPTWDPSTDPKSGSPRMFLHPGALEMATIDDAMNERCEYWHGIAEEMQT